MARKFAAVVFSLGCVQTSAVLGLGLGEMTLDSYLNEPLDAQVDLLNVGGLHEDQIRVRLATSDDFARMGVDRAYFLTSISFDVEIDDNGRARILITSEDAVLEPYLDFIVEARWPSGRLLREYTVLVDPPVFDQSNPVISASNRVAELDGEPESAKKKSATNATTGTSVDVRDSNLAAGQMPERAFNSSTSPAPVAGTRYMIHRDDTLWEIASTARPAGASVYQTMLDIQRLNPDAFIGGNINRVKAGYIVYLPDENDISSANLPQALAEVREQNNAWREGKPLAEPEYVSGPSLRISAEQEDATPGGSTASSAAANDAAREDAEKTGLQRTELEQRLNSMQQQVETLQRIVSLKDEQIAALQRALTDPDKAADVALPAADAMELGELEGEFEDSVFEDGIPGDREKALAALEAQEGIETSTPKVVEKKAEVAVVEPAPVAPAVERAAPKEESPGFFSNLWFVLGALVLAVLGFIFMRRRGAADDDDDIVEVEPTPAADVFADVELTEQVLEVEDDEPEIVLDEDVVEQGPATDNRGYGERKHDEYASDEASDALAEAEIYIAYGRYPQAIDLLKNALGNDPGNAAYRLKLLQLYMETGNRTAAAQEFAELESIGDADSMAAGRLALDGHSSASAPRADFATDGGEPEVDLLAESEASLESDFSGLEIEELESDISLEDELDLSADFDDTELGSDADDEDLVISADSDGLSTKLDLARAYMDMGDDDGARQILEEVAAEGSEELQAEAKALLERIG
tara:strand:- start:49151 stop:51421 length:2271 start_codon:yes stop_codon:yes gene_type:complete